MDSNSKKRNFTAEFSQNPVGFMEQHTMTADFAKGLRDNYKVQTDPHKTIPVAEQVRTGWQKFWGTNKTQPVSEELQRNTILNDANKALTESGLKTHFVKVMEDRDRKGVFNLTPDVDAYRAKYKEKQEQYAAQEIVTPKQQKKLDALGRIVASFDKISARDQDDDKDKTHLQAGYFPYKTDIGSDGKGVGSADLHSKKNAAGRWTFTGQMNGCAIAIQNTLDQREQVGQSKAFHFPSPASYPGKLEKWQEDKRLTSWFGVNGYKGDGDQVDAFNALHVKDTEVQLFSQKQTRMRGATTLTGDVNVFQAGTKPIEPQHQTISENTGGVFGLKQVHGK